MKIEQVQAIGVNGSTTTVGHFSSSHTTVLQLGKLELDSGEKYTLHGYVKASRASTMVFGSKSADVGTSWSEFAFTFNADSNGLQVTFSPAEYWLSNWKLEKGDIITPWTPSPIDSKEDLIEQKSEWTQTATGIRSDVSALSKNLDTANSSWQQTATNIRQELNKKADDEEIRTLINTEAGDLKVEIAKKTTSGEVLTMIEASVDDIRLSTGTLTWEAKNSSLKEDGTFSCKNGNFDGDITAKSLTLGDGEQCKLLWGEAVPTYAWGAMASLGYFGGPGGPIHSLDIDIEGIAFGSATLSEDGETVVPNTETLIGANGSGIAFVTAPNGLYLNGKKLNEYDWSEYSTANTSDTWVPVSTSDGKMQHRYIPADAFTVQSNGIFRKYGNVVAANFYGTSATSLPSVPSNWRPPNDISIPVTIIYNGNPYMGYVQIRSGGSMQCTYYDYGSGKGTPQSGSAVYGVATWIIN